MSFDCKLYSSQASAKLCHDTDLLLARRLLTRALAWHLHPTGQVAFVIVATMVQAHALAML